eukprot:scaffold2473_cov265-Prasinococcus_capsulatus_cf.AAC.1
MPQPCRGSPVLILSATVCIATPCLDARLRQRAVFPPSTGLGSTACEVRQGAAGRTAFPELHSGPPI